MKQMSRHSVLMLFGVLLSYWVALNQAFSAPNQLATQPPSIAETAPAEIAPNTSSNTSSNNASRLQFSQTLSDYRAAIEEIEAHEGAWGTGLAEQLTGLGRTYQSRGQHVEAIDIFERAAHVDRINQGLYSITQVPIIESQIESLIARGAWDEVHDRHQYLYWLHQRSYGDGDPRMLPVLDKLGKWYINDYAMNPEKRQPENLIAAYELFVEATQIISSEYGENDLRMIEPLRGLALSNWYLREFDPNNSNQVDFSRYNNQLGPDFDSEKSNYLLRNDFGSRRVIDYNTSDPRNQISRYGQGSYVNGKESINRVITIYQNNPKAPAGAAAAAKVELADWHMMWEKYHTAKVIYRDAFESLAKDDATKTRAAKFFAYPVALPAMSLLETDLGVDILESAKSEASESPVQSMEQIQYVLVQYDVDQYGSARNINVLEKFPEDGPQSIQVKRSLQSTRFRPRLVDGEPAAAKGIVQKFIFSNN